LMENRARDMRSVAALAALGWQSVRVWEHEDPELAAARIELVLRARRDPKTALL
jgi:DNA mismatch endonuclease (patch repair protein)